jgi:hypothetical protein
MAKPNYLGQIRKRMDDLHKEYTALTEAYQLLSATGESRGRKAKLPLLDQLAEGTTPKARKGKRGRPAGVKNKPGYQKPGPKVKVSKEIVSKKNSITRGIKTIRKVGSISGSSKKRGRIPDLSSKIQEIVAKTGRFTTNSHITDKLATLYPGKTRSDLGKYISVILANMKARKELGVVTVDSKGQKMRSGLWGLMNWFEGGKPKSEYLK